MHKNLSRIFAALALLTLVPVVAFASSSRVAALNVPGDYIKDYTGLYTYVSGVGSVGNLVYVEPNTAMGAVLGNLWEGHLGTWAVHLRQNHPALGQATASGSINPSDASIGDDPNSAGEAFDLMWGHKMGSGSLGLRVNRSWDSNDTAPTTEGNGSGGRNVFGVGAGFGFAMNSNTDVELSGLFQNRSFTGAALADDGGSAYQLAGRAMMKAGGNLMLTPVVKIYSFDLSTATIATPAVPSVKVEDKRTGWQAGLAGNWSIGSDDLFVLGGQLANNTEKTPNAAAGNTKVSETYYPNVFMGLETHVNSWLTLRFGAQNAMMYSRKTDTATASTTDKEMHFNYNMGAGVKLGSLMMDATLASSFWNNPVSNTFNNPGGAPFPNVTATYSF